MTSVSPSARKCNETLVRGKKETRRISGHSFQPLYTSTALITPCDFTAKSNPPVLKGRERILGAPLWRKRDEQRNFVCFPLPALSSMESNIKSLCKDLIKVSIKTRILLLCLQKVSACFLKFHFVGRMEPCRMGFFHYQLGPKRESMCLNFSWKAYLHSPPPQKHTLKEK